MGPRTHAKNPSIAHANSPSQPRRARHANKPPSLTRRALLPVPTASLIADLFISQNEDCWGGSLSGGCWFGYEPKSRKWFKADDLYCSHWEAGAIAWSDPDHVDAGLDVVALLRDIIRPMADLADTATQVRLGGFHIIAAAMKFLQNDERCRMLATDAEYGLPPRPKRLEFKAAHEQSMKERHQSMGENNVR